MTGLKEALDFTSRTLYPEEADTPEREPFVRAIVVKTLESLLDHLVIPSVPSSPSSIPGWLNLIISSVAIEDAVLPVSSVNDQLHHSRPLKTFWEKQTGKEYANKRRHDTADLVRMLVLKGWGRWEGVEKTREKEITVVVKVELNDDEDQPLKERSKEEDEAREAEGDGWGFGETSEDQIEQAGVKEVNQDDAEEAEDGWGFNEESIPPMSSADQAPQEEDEASGWDLDVTAHSSLPDSTFSLPQVDPSTEIEARIEHTPEPQPQPESQPEIQQEFKPEPEPEPQPEHVSASAPTSVPTKPPREAKRLGKKVAKKSKTEEYDPWDQPFDNDNSLSASTSSLSNSTQALSAEAPPNNDIAPIKKPAREAKKLGKKVGKWTNKEEERDFWDADIPAEDLGGGENSLYHTAGALGDKVENGGGGNGGGRRWDDDPTLTSPQTTAAAMPSSPQKRKRTELREEKKVIEEKYLVSTACEKLLDIGRGLLEELEELQSSR